MYSTLAIHLILKKKCEFNDLLTREVMLIQFGRINSISNTPVYYFDILADF